MEPDLSGIFWITMVARNVMFGSPGIHLMHVRIKNGNNKVNPNKAGLFEGSFAWGWESIWRPLHISRRTYPISIKPYTNVKQSI